MFTDTGQIIGTTIGSAFFLVVFVIPALLFRFKVKRMKRVKEYEKQQQIERLTELMEKTKSLPLRQAITTLSEVGITVESGKINLPEYFLDVCDTRLIAKTILTIAVSHPSLDICEQIARYLVEHTTREKTGVIVEIVLFCVEQNKITGTMIGACYTQILKGYTIPS